VVKPPSSLMWQSGNVALWHFSVLHFHFMPVFAISLLYPAVSFPVCPYLFPCSYVLSSPKALCNSPEKHKSVTFVLFLWIIGSIFIYLHRVSQETQDMVGSTFPITTSDKKSQTPLKSVGALCAGVSTDGVACGEPGMRRNCLRISFED